MKTIMNINKDYTTMKVNRIQWDRFKLTWDTVKISTAITFADRHMDEMDIIQDQETGEIIFERVNEKQRLKEQMQELEKQGRDYLDREEYMLMQNALEIWKLIKKDYDKL